MTLLDCARCKAAFPREVLPQGPASTCPVCLERGRFFARPSEIAGREARGFLQRERRGPIPSSELRGPLYAPLDLGPFTQWLGPLPPDVMIDLHGPPGSGKSTFATRLGLALARGGVTVVYAALEEAMGPALQARMHRLGRHPRLVITDARTVHELEDDLGALAQKGAAAGFVIVDSVGLLDVSVALYRRWKARGLGQLLLRHETTQRSPRSGLELSHEADLVARANRLRITVHKNRFGPTPTDFPVLGEPDEETP